MHKLLKHFLVAGSALLIGSAVMAKLPAPSDEAKAKAAEAAAKTAWSGKVDGYLLCKVQDRVAAHYDKNKIHKVANKEAKPATATPACADPGPFVYTPAAAPAAPAATPPPVAAAPVAPAPAATPAKKP